MIQLEFHMRPQRLFIRIELRVPIVNRAGYFATYSRRSSYTFSHSAQVPPQSYHWGRLILTGASGGVSPVVMWVTQLDAMTAHTYPEVKHLEFLEGEVAGACRTFS